MLIAPVSGVLVPLTDVPDPAFAQKLVGDGIAIDPVTDRILAPCNGVVAQLHSAGHAVTIKTDAGDEVLIHVGLDTVMLKGRGFSPHARAGDVVRAGRPAAVLRRRPGGDAGRSLLTEMVVTTMEGVTVEHAWQRRGHGRTRRRARGLAIRSDDRSRRRSAAAPTRSTRSPSSSRIRLVFTRGRPPSSRRARASSSRVSASCGGTGTPTPRA